MYEPSPRSSVTFGAPTFPSATRVGWIGPVEADRLTSGANFLPDSLWQALRALRLVGSDDDVTEFSEARRRDIRGMCCGDASVTLVEGMAAVRRILRFAYLDGEVFTAAIAADGGESAVDRTFTEPPDSREHILHPDHYLAGDEPSSVPAPEPPADVVVGQR